MRSSRASFGVSAMTRTGSSSAFPPSMTCRRGGSSCAPAPPPARTTFCASSPLTSRPSTPRSMMQLSLGASQRCWNKGTPPAVLEPRHCPACPAVRRARSPLRFFRPLHSALGLLVRHDAVIQARAPAAAARLRAALQGDGALPSSAAATQALAHLRDLGYEAPDWAVICSGAAAPPAPDRDDDPWPFRGWQRSAARACDERTYETHLSHLTSASRALLLSQAGPFASRALNLLPTRDDVAIPSAQFRVLLLRRLRLPLPLAPRRCSCHGVLDSLGDHRTACATSGVSVHPRAAPRARRRAGMP